jgi:ssDNA-binding Zn-finger/Zn-ribbon topoisomerase 1
VDRQSLEQALAGALEEEIAYLQRTQAERTTSAVGGTRLREAAGWILYDFLLERDFLIPDDSRVVARIGNERLNGQVISIRGMELTLGLERDIGPHIARVEISVDATALLESILARFQDPALSTLPDALARKVFGFAQAHLSRTEVLSQIALKAEQPEALEKAVGSEIQFIWGPPGTGKTQTLAAMCEVLVELGESVLLVSHTNIAVDEAILRAAGHGGPLYETPSYLEGKLLRYGTPRHPDLARIKELLAEDVARRLGADLESRLAEISGQLARNSEARRELERVLSAWANAERAAEEAKSRERALGGAVAVLSKRCEEHRDASNELLWAEEELDRVLNPRGWRRIFRRNPVPFRAAVGRANQRKTLAQKALSVAEAHEKEARRAAQSARLEAERLAALPKLAREAALQRDDELADESYRLEEERTRIQQELSGLLKRVIYEATFIASTLTRAAVDQNLCRRTFENVIIDEASMAPLPLVYLASLAARKRVILVGDFEQLPPIVQSDGELAKQWLGRDIFEQAGVNKVDLPNDKRDLRVDLWTQYRMASKIRQFASDNFYGGRLRDDFSEDRQGDILWAKYAPAGSQVSMVDTTSLGAWSQRSPGAHPSKFNVYSALVAVELAETLRKGSKVGDGAADDRPIGIITPYRAQANLLTVLLKERRLETSVSAGTIHSFQGLESDAIIFDFVEDEPNWKAGPLLIEQGPKLINVAVTRAKHRLFVLGSRAHVRKHLKRSPLWDLVEYAAETDIIAAEDFLRADFHRSVADANARIRHGEVSDLDTNHLRVCSERDFFAALDYDLSRVERRVVIFAPFLGRRVEEVVPRLRDCIERDVDVYVVTRPSADCEGANLRSWYETVHQRLGRFGVKLVFFRMMHQKLVFIDDRILYVGGLNPLSHVDTAEIMDRWDSKAVADAHAEQVRLKDLLSVWSDPDDPAMRTCPRPECGDAPLLVVAPVTRDRYDPMFWGCTNHPACDYKRRFSWGPRRSGPRICNKCDTPMSLEHKPSGVWWVCRHCNARRKVQEGEGDQAQLLLTQPKRPPKKAASTPRVAVRPQAGVKGTPPRSDAAPSTDQATDSLLALLRSKGLEVIDERPHGGHLWVIGGKELYSFLSPRGFVWGPRGARATGNRAGWYSQ